MRLLLRDFIDWVFDPWFKDELLSITCAGYLSNPPSFIDDEAALLELETLSATNLLDKDPS